MIDGPVTFNMGSPPEEPERNKAETLHPQSINRGLAITTKEVTREQYERFVKASPKHRPHYAGDVTSDSPDHQGPQVWVSWYDAVAYCNWFGAEEKLDACYEPNDQGEYAEGMKLVPDFLKRSGCRLPTEAEWEYACRAGAATSRYYGGTLDLLGNDAWYLQNSPTTQASRCGRLKPNEIGRFDPLGNGDEWCLDERHGYSQEGGKSDSENMNTYLLITNKYRPLLRGGTFSYRAANVRSAFRVSNPPSNRLIYYGFRPARTYP